MRILLLIAAVLCGAPAFTVSQIAIADEPAVLLPRQINLTRPAQQHGVLLLRTAADTSGPSSLPGILIPDAHYHSDDESIATVDAMGIVHAVGDGETTISATAGSLTSRTKVIVQGQEQTPTIRFRHDIQSILSRHACNSGACHGALAGKGGFRLSLLGFDDNADYYQIAMAAGGRRIESADPGRSLLLAKPTGALPHKGGLRLQTDDPDYARIAAWIAEGAQGPKPDDARLQRIQVLPDASLLAPGDKTRLLVQAVYDDGTIRDVTSWAKFNASDEAVAGVDQNGAVTVRGSGAAAVRVWFGSKIALARITVPYANTVSRDVFADAPRRNFIDSQNLRLLETLNLPPSPPCDDATFIRRATLDTIGRLPTPEETAQYVAATAPNKRDALVDELLLREEFVDYWSYKWSDLLLVNGTRLRPAAVESFYDWIRDSVRQNKPWNQFVSEILTATGKTKENGATNFYALHQTPEEMTENACQAFMGLSIGCAKCHNHPLEKWTNDQYYAMANLFARVRAKGWGGEPRNGDGLRTLIVADSGDLVQPNTGRPQAPAALDQPPLDINSPQDRRIALADWMTAPDNPYFARAVCNRIWANFFGVGLVEQVDDLRTSNPASNDPLLQALSQHLVENRFDLRDLMRTILQSETYARSSTALPGNRDEQRYYSRYYPKRLMAEVMLDSIDTVMQTSTPFNEIAFPGADVQKTSFYPKGTRALQLYDSSVKSYFLKTFGRNTREITCECERSDEPSMVQVLHMANGTTINEKLALADNAIAVAMAMGCSTNAIIHVIAMARRAGHAIGLDDFEAASRKVPVIA
ncbi:MAG: DUF1549 domain-containing protein, partial [Planctomycetota bacterium]